MMHYRLCPRWTPFQRLTARHSLTLRLTGRERRTNAHAQGVAIYYTRCGFGINATTSDRCVQCRSAKLGNAGAGSYCYFTQFPSRKKERDTDSETEKTLYFHVSPR